MAIGPSQGFIEPLEATALLFVQRAAASFVDVLERGDLGEAAQAAFNDGLNARVDGERDYIVTHYKSNTRTDTDYWRANAANSALSEPLQLLLRTWLSSQPDRARHRERHLRHRPRHVVVVLPARAAWACSRDGAARSAPRRTPAPTSTGIDDLIRRSTPNFPDHRAWLRDIPPHAERIELWRRPADAGRRATLGAL